jgi:hypothetical protein
MLSLLTIWNSFQSYANTFQGGWYRPNTDFQPAVNDISKKLWEQWTGQAEKSQEIKDHLSPFLKTKNYIVENVVGNNFGVLKYPSDYGRFSSARIILNNQKCVPCPDVNNGQCENGDFKTAEEVSEEYKDNLTQRMVELIDNQKWFSCLNHLTKNPTFESPKMTQYQGGFNVAPRKVSVIVLDYYVRPKEGTFAYTIAPGDTNTGAGDYLIYDPVNSIQLEWPETVLNEFVIELGIRFGLFTRSEFIISMSQNQNR